MRHVLLIALMAIIGCAQVSSSEYTKEHGQYGRSDGIFQHADTNGLDSVVNGYRLNSVTKQCLYEDFTDYGDGDQACLQNDWTACSGTDTEVNLFTFPSGNAAYVYNIGAQVAGVDMDAGSLDIAGTQTDNLGLELGFGMYGASGAPFIIGESPAFYTCATITVADVSGTDDLHLGFRRYEPGNVTFDNYNDLASIGPLAGDVTLETIDDNGATTTTDTTNNLADGGTDTYCVYVSAAGVVTYTIDGLPPLTTAAFTFDDSDPVIPFIHVLQAATLSGEIDVTEWEVGYQ